MRHFSRSFVVFFLAFWLTGVTIAQTKSAPKKAASGKAASSRATSGKATSSKATPAKVTPAKAAPAKATPGKATAGTGKTAPSKPAPANRPELALQTGHSGPVLSLAYSPDGAMLASASVDGTIKLWDTREREQIRSIAAHTGNVSVVVWSPDGKTLASIGGDGRVKFWDAASGRLLRDIAPRAAISRFAERVSARALAFSPDGTSVAVGYGDILSSSKLTGIANNPTLRKNLRPPGGEMVVYNARTGVVQRTFVQQSGPVFKLAWSPDGKTLAASGAAKQIHLWDTTKTAPPRVLRGHTNGITDLAFSPDGRTLASASKDRTIRFWDAGSGALRVTLTAHETDVNSVAFSPDGSVLVSGGLGSPVLFWDAQSGQRLPVELKSKVYLHEMAFSPDGNTLAISDHDKIKLFNTRSGEPQGSFEARPRWVQNIAYSPDGKILATTGGFDNLVLLWDTGTGRLLRTLKSSKGSLSSLAFSPDGQWLAAGSRSITRRDGNDIMLWNVHTGALVRTLPGHQRIVPSVAFSRDGILAASSSDDSAKPRHGEIKFWQPSTGRLLRTIISQADSIGSLIFLPDGNLATSTYFGSGKPGFLEIWNPRNGTLLRKLDTGQGGASSVALSRDGSILAAAGVDKTIRLWNARSRAYLRTLPQATRVYGLSLSPDGKTLASGGHDNVIRLWDIGSGRQLRVLQGHEDLVWDIAFSPDGKRLASGSNDTTTRIWNVGEGRQLASFLMTPTESEQGLYHVEPLWLTTTPEGYYDSAEGADYLVKWRFNRKLLPFYHFEETYRRPDLLQRALRGERIAARPLLITRVPPAIRLLALANIPNKPGKLRVLIQAADDSPLPNANFQFYVNGVLIPDQSSDFSTAEGKPIVVDGKPIVVDGKPIVVDGKPIVVDGKPIVVDGKPIVVDGKPVTANGHGASGLQTVSAVNGSPVSVAAPGVTASGVTASGGDLTSSYAFHRLYVMDVALPAEEEIVLRAVVTDSEGNKSNDGLRMQRPQIVPQKGNLYVLSVGVSSYRNPLYNISYAASDARSIADTLRAQQGRQYRKVQTTVLNDKGATVQSIRAALRALKAAGPNDTVMVFLSGHGIAAGGKTYFAPWGVFVRDLEGTCIEWREIVDSLAGLYAKKLLFTDACHSGSKLGERQATHSQLAETVRRTSGIVMFASSQADEFSFEDKTVQQGTFSLALADGLAGKADLDADGNITLPELAIYVPKRVSAATKGLQNPQLVLVQDFNPQTVLAKN